MLTAPAPGNEPISSDPTTLDRKFLLRRAQAVDRLVRAGLTERQAQAWIAAWLASTDGLTDFRAAPDYWDLAVQYAIEERRRGYLPPGDDIEESRDCARESSA